MEFQLPTPEETEQMGAVLWNELRRIHLKGWYEKRLTLPDVAGTDKGTLSKALNHGEKPGQRALYAWLNKWYDAGIITDEEAKHIMNLAGYIDAQTRREALQATHSRLTAVSTGELPPHNMGPTTDRVSPSPTTEHGAAAHTTNSTIRAIRFHRPTRLENA